MKRFLQTLFAMLLLFMLATPAVAQQDAQPPPVNTTFYFNPDGGQSYHADNQCPSIAPKYYEKMKSFPRDALEDKRYDKLTPCETCVLKTTPSPWFGGDEFERAKAVLEARLHADGEAGYRICGFRIAPDRRLIVIDVLMKDQRIESFQLMLDGAGAWRIG